MTPWDPGLQPERTALAWRRTALAVATAAAIVLRSAIARGAWAGAIIAGLALVVGAVLLGLSGRGYAAVTRRLGEGVPAGSLVDLRGATAAVVLLACAAVLTAAH